ncbi:MAG: triple tyrosine motif-containing protein [Saonia sp.]
MALRVLVLFFTTLFYFQGYGQELPPIENFTPIDYGAENQNWAISQSKEKDIYIANNSGLLEFNGAQWKLYHSPNRSEIRSVRAIDDVIYTGCYMEFGYWKRDEFHGLKYYSLSENSKTPLLEDEVFWNILEYDDWVLFQSLQRIYIYNTTDESINVIDSNSTRAQIFDFDDSVYFQKINQGIFRIDNGTSVLVSAHPIVKKNIVVGIFRVNNLPLILTEQGTFYFLDGDNLIPWKTKIDTELTAFSVYSSIQLRDNSIVLGTISNGIYHIDDKGEILQKINQEKGLNNNTVLSIFEDMERNLWLGLDNGVSVINLDSPFKEYSDKFGKLGVVYASIIFEDYLYLGTNQGLLFKKMGTDDTFSFIESTNGQVWCLKEIDGTLFCGHNAGTFLIDQNSALLVSDFPGTWDIKKIKNNPNLLLQGNYNGLSIIEKKDDSWRFRNKIEGFTNSSRFYEFIGENKIVVNHEYKGIYKLDVDPGYVKVLNLEREASKGIGASLVTYNGDVLYTTDKGVFKFNENQQKFSSDSIWRSKFFAEKEWPIGILMPDPKAKRLWCFTNQNILFVSPGKFNNAPRATKISVPSFFRKNLGVLGFESMTPLKDERYLIGISNGYITLDLDKLKTKEYLVRISSVFKKSRDSQLEKVRLTHNGTFKFSENNLNFSYNVPEFDKYTAVKYQYKLDGIYDTWSDWSIASEVSFENLPYGTYSFMVRAKAGNTLTENVASFDFEINRPWYLSNGALLGYGLLIILFSILIHRLYRSYYRKQQILLLKENKKKLKRKKLKAQKKVAQIKNEKLRQEIESKNRELAVSTMSIIRKNEFLNRIKGQLNEASNDTQIKSVIRTIDRDINNSDDWKFFEEAFNNADKDFLKKVKGLHSNLTPNDLRLCAYLRLNLSSKEIAPLLNISVRSVEVKRYRLRKKMELPHEDSLTSYILNL